MFYSRFTNLRQQYESASWRDLVQRDNSWIPSKSILAKTPSTTSNDQQQSNLNWVDELISYVMIRIMCVVKNTMYVKY